MSSQRTLSITYWSVSGDETSHFSKCFNNSRNQQVLIPNVILWVQGTAKPTLTHTSETIFRVEGCIIPWFDFLERFNCTIEEAGNIIFLKLTTSALEAKILWFSIDFR